ncbi:uncharacterized protein LOC142340899 [Convolutriloba macropyga]|uniref:uncharacterized protein LOC142340899 n=1 Tax=Convolutriloba macropyga TaxID=536237 RepID=UPI003F51DB2B
MSGAQGWYKGLCACHMLAFVWSIPAITLFGIALCCKRCRKENTEYMVGLIICIGIQIFMTIIAVALLGSKGDIDTDVEGARQEKYMFILLLIALIIGAACAAFAVIACACRRKNSLKC